MRCQTLRFGELEIGEEEIIAFPLGVPGFNRLSQFFFVPVPDNPAFCWLQAVAAPEVAFLLTDPFLFFPDYVVNLPEAERELLGVEREEDATVYVILRVPRDGKAQDITANLLAPLIINRRTRRGLQLVQEGTAYGLRERLFRLPSAGEGPGRRAGQCSS